MSLTIIQAGLLDTVQDGGRTGYRHLGINPGGVMDAMAMRTANIVLGNDPGEAVLELHFPSSVFLFHAPAILAIGGADFGAEVDGEACEVNQPFLVTKGAILSFKKRIKGQRAYLAVKGGWQWKEWLGSGSTNLKLGYGGWQGRALKKGDELLHNNDLVNAGEQTQKRRGYNWRAAEFVFKGYEENRILLLPGKDWPSLTEASKEQLVNGAFLITRQADRMGYRLQGEALERTEHTELLSSAVNAGAVQLLPDGQLIILLADHQVTGGYPVIAYVITAYQGRLAQMGPDAACYFKMTDMATAEELLRQQHKHLRQLQWISEEKWKS